jgi:lipopolysaccharide export system protein LptA
MAASKLRAICAVSALVFASSAFALKSDNDQPMNVDADHAKTVQSKTGLVNDPDITDYDGDVVMTQGSIKSRGDHARVYRMSKDAKDPNAGKIIRIVLTGKQAHMQQVHDGDCALMTSDANTIDHNPITDIAELTGGVVVVQAGRGEFHGEHMLYNTSTGDMESGDKASSNGRIHTVMEPKTENPPAASTNNCGFPTSPKAVAAAAAKAASKPDVNAGDKPAADTPAKPAGDAKPASAKPADAKKSGGAD